MMINRVYDRILLYILICVEILYYDY